MAAPGGAGTLRLAGGRLPAGAARRGRQPHRNRGGGEERLRDAAGGRWGGERPWGPRLRSAPRPGPPPDEEAAGGYQATGGALATAARGLCPRRPRGASASACPGAAAAERPRGAGRGRTGAGAALPGLGRSVAGVPAPLRRPA